MSVRFLKQKCTSAEFKIELSDTEQVTLPPYRYSMNQRAEIRRQINEMIEIGVVEPSVSEYSSPVVLVKKQDGSWRMCVDLRQVNKKIKGDSYPLPHIKDCLHALNGAKWFICIDLNSGYWQFPIRKEDQHILAFITSDGLYHFTCMPFGIKTAPAFCQRAIDVVFSGLKWKCVICYQDDLIFFAPTFELLLERFRLGLQRLKEHNLTIKPSKCVFGVRSVKFLGHIVDNEGIKMDPEKIEALKMFPMPTCVRDIQVLMGFLGFYRPFYENLSVEGERLFRLLRKDVKFEMGDAERET
ncbi:Retrovirus-related Pol polyprotein from transposon 17.6-like protein, partial [Leptotrombidium deliense]